MASKDLLRYDGQGELALARRAEHAEERLRAMDAENKLMRQLLQGRAVAA